MVTGLACQLAMGYQAEIKDVWANVALAVLQQSTYNFNHMSDLIEVDGTIHLK